MRGQGRWFFLMIATVLGLIFWASGGSEVRNLAPYYWKWVTGQTATVMIEGVTFQVEVADTASERVTGLSHRTSLPHDKGMLFAFPESDIYSFTMRDTEIPLDIIWIEDSAVVYIAHNVQPGTHIITPDQPARYVLEIQGKAARRSSIEIGDPVTISF